MISLRRNAVYNSLIAEMRSSLPGSSRRSLPYVLVLWFSMISASFAADWAAPEQELARKIAAATGPGAVSLEVVNRSSSLGKKESEDISRGLRSQLEGLGLRSVKPEQAAATVTVSLSENLQSYVWVAEIHQGAGEFSVAMVSTPRPTAAQFGQDAAPLTIRRTPVWSQQSRI